MQLSIANFNLEVTETRTSTALSKQYLAFENKLTTSSDFQIEVSDHLPTYWENAEILFHANHSLEEESKDTFWQIRKLDNELLFIFGDYFTREFPIVVASTKDRRNWTVHTKVKNGSGYDPFPHPAGDILLFHMLSEMQGVAMHASVVEFEGKGYLFTGFSGIGKSTMAKLWQDSGATTINDDRVFIRQNEQGEYIVYNSPMPYYVDQPKSVILSGMFLLKQAPENGYKKLKGAHAMSRITAHCLQHNYNPLFVSNLLKTTSSIAAKIPIFELEVYPDQRIVELVKTLV